MNTCESCKHQRLGDERCCKKGVALLNGDDGYPVRPYLSFGCTLWEPRLIEFEGRLAQIPTPEGDVVVPVPTRYAHAGEAGRKVRVRLEYVEED